MPLNWLLGASIAYETPLLQGAGSIMAGRFRGVMLHVCDDRDMDVRARDRGVIERLYQQFDTWLLDYDRPRMTAAFES
jgi:hypothetical protein